MKLHLSGVKLPKLGTIQDRVYRDYMVKEAHLEAKKGEMMMLMALTNPSIEDPNKRREWADTIKGLWTRYLSLLMNVEIPESTEKEIQMMEYYQTVVKPAKLRLFKDKDGNLNVSGLNQLLRK
ncbi:MAG: hypothetical protein JWO62_3806 [Acidimicrobiaceae bacterium]|nr:hypothetical protein [Acidimicrobiaceae bacterium]